MATALLVIDVQGDFCHKNAPTYVNGAAAALPKVRQAIDSARESGVPVIWVVREHDASGADVETFRTHMFEGDNQGICVPGTPGCNIARGLKRLPQGGELRVVKKRMSAFFGTSLDLILRRMGIQKLALAGVQTPNCIRATAVDAAALDYAVTVLSDATASKSKEVQASNLADLEGQGCPSATVEAWGAGLGPDAKPSGAPPASAAPTGGDDKPKKERKPRERKPRERKPREPKSAGEEAEAGAGEGGAAEAEEEGGAEEKEEKKEAEASKAHAAPTAGQFSQGVSAVPTGKAPGSAGTGELKLKVEISQCNIKKIDMKAYGIEKPVCQAFVKLNDQVFATSADYGLDPVWETSAEFGLNDPKTDKVSAVLYCQGMKIGDECTFLLDKLIKGKATYKGLIVPGGKVDMLFTAETFGLEKEEESTDDFMDFL